MEFLDGKEEQASLKNPFPKNRYRASVRVSSVVNASLAPVWEETFYFDLPDHFEDARLVITLWDSDSGDSAKGVSQARIAGAGRIFKDFK